MFKSGQMKKKDAQKSLDDCDYNNENFVHTMNERTNVLCMCVCGTLFLIGDDETERDR